MLQLLGAGHPAPLKDALAFLYVLNERMFVLLQQRCNFRQWLQPWAPSAARSVSLCLYLCSLCPSVLPLFHVSGSQPCSQAVLHDDHS